jgi:hypothetical protein
MDLGFGRALLQKTEIGIVLVELMENDSGGAGYTAAPLFN